MISTWEHRAGELGSNTMPGNDFSKKKKNVIIYRQPLLRTKLSSLYKQNCFHLFLIKITFSQKTSVLSKDEFKYNNPYLKFLSILPQ